MKKRLMVIGLAILFMLTSVVTCYAATETDVTLKLSKTEVKAGETFTVTLSATCPDGINGIDTTYTYDTEKLELVSANVASSDFASLGTDNQITVICTKSDESITSADIYVLTFKVKDGVAENSVAKINIAETMLDSDAETDSEHTIPAQEKSITVVSAEENPPSDGENGEQNPPADDGTGSGEQNPPADEGTGSGEQNPPADEGAGSGEQNPPAEVEQKPGENQPTTDGTTVVVGDDTVAKTDIPKAGINAIIVLAIIAVAGIAILLYKKSKSFQDIK